LTISSFSPFSEKLRFLGADDTVLMAESSADLQNQLNSFQDYCSIWKLKVNTDKRNRL
jgi:hypothetical protein